MDLDKLSTNELGKLFPVIIAEPNPEWKISSRKIPRQNEYEIFTALIQ